MTVFSIIKTLFGKEAEPVQSLANPARAIPANARAWVSGQPAPPVRSPHDGALADLIGLQDTSSQSLMAGSFELVGLDEIKQALGERWAGLAARASWRSKESGGASQTATSCRC